VHDSLLVGRRQAVRDLDRVVDGLPRRQRTSRQTAAQRLSFEKLGHDVGGTIRRANVVNRGDVGVVEQPRRTRLLLETAQPIGISREGRG
jgi:hypothetical protein